MLSRIRVACSAKIKMILNSTKKNGKKIKEKVFWKKKRNEKKKRYERVQEAKESERTKVGQKSGLKVWFAQQFNPQKPGDDPRAQRDSQVLPNVSMVSRQDMQIPCKKQNVRSKLPKRSVHTLVPPHPIHLH